MSKGLTLIGASGAVRAIGRLERSFKGINLGDPKSGDPYKEMVAKILGLPVNRVDYKEHTPGRVIEETFRFLEKKQKPHQVRKHEPDEVQDEAYISDHELRDYIFIRKILGEYIPPFTEELYGDDLFDILRTPDEDRSTRETRWPKNSTLDFPDDSRDRDFIDKSKKIIDYFRIVLSFQIVKHYLERSTSKSYTPFDISSEQSYLEACSRLIQVMEEEQSRGLPLLSQERRLISRYFTSLLRLTDAKASPYAIRDWLSDIS